MSGSRRRRKKRPARLDAPPPTVESSMSIEDSVPLEENLSARRRPAEALAVAPAVEEGIEEAPGEASGEEPIPEVAVATGGGGTFPPPEGMDQSAAVEGGPRAGVATEADSEPVPLRVLIVDDNAAYRKAFRRRLRLEGFDVIEAGDGDQALERLGAQRPGVVITDLAMRDETEGLTLIRRIKALQPLLPVIMISAVGTFEEGAEASRLGATAVLSKSRIDEELGGLVTRVRAALRDFDAATATLAHLQHLRDELLGADPDHLDAGRLAEAIAAVQAYLGRDDLHPHVKGEAFDLLLQLSSRQVQAAARAQAASLLDAGGGRDPMSAAVATLAEELPGYRELERESAETLRTAEFLYQQQEHVGGEIDFSRNVSFSYCFAVENEAKHRLRRRLQRLLSSEETFRLIGRFLEEDRRHLSLYFHQAILHAMRDRQMEITIDNVRQTLIRILDYRARYKPDGLKALGIVVLCFGREFSYRDPTGIVFVNNPMGLRGLADDDETLFFAERLIALQHYRNPYIHPEITEPEKVGQLREVAFDCLRLIDRLA